MLTRDSTDLTDPGMVPSLADRWPHHTGGTRLRWSHATGGRQLTTVARRGDPGGC